MKVYLFLPDFLSVMVKVFTYIPPSVKLSSASIRKETWGMYNNLIEYIMQVLP